MTRILSKYWFDRSNKALDDIESIKDVIRPIIKLINKHHIEWINDDDARANYFIGIKKVLQSAQLSYLNIRFCLVDTEYWERYIKDYEKNEITKILSEYQAYILFGWMYGISAIIEESSRLILRNISSEACNSESDNFKNIYSCLLKKLDLQEHVALFDLFRLLRNLIHTNGVFNPPKKENVMIEFREIDYDFVVGEKPKFYNYDLISSITIELVQVLYEICFHEAVIEIDSIQRIK